MANLLTMADIQAILKLHRQGWPQRRIARELDVDRETVAKYVRASRCIPKPAKAPLGSDEVRDQAAEAPARPLAAEAFRKRRASKPAHRPPYRTYHLANSKPAKAPLGSPSQNQPKRLRLASRCAEAPVRPGRCRPLSWWLVGWFRRPQFPWRRKAVAAPASRIGR